MRRRVLAAILAVTALAIGLFGVPLAVMIARVVNEEAVLRLERQAVLAARAVPLGFDNGDDPVELPVGTDGVAFSLYDASGDLVSGAGPQTSDSVTSAALRNEVVDVEVAERRIVAVPVVVDEQVVGAIRAEQPTSGVDSNVRRLVGVLVAVGAVVLLMASIVGWIVAGRLARPVARLRDSAVRLGDGDFAVTVPKSDIAELDEAAAAMTVTAERLGDLVARERQFSSNVSHQLRTPLAGLRAAIETELAFPRADRDEVLHEALVDIDRLEQIVSELLAIARSADVSNREVLISEVLTGVQSDWFQRFAAQGRPLMTAAARFTPPVRGSETVLRHAVDVLLDNALKHGAGPTSVECLVDDDSVTLRISDRGPGFTGPVGSVGPVGDSIADQGGLGLPLAKRLVESMPGRLVVAEAGPHPQIDLILQRAAATGSASPTGS
jgi:signal transduction histidine kinase